MPGVPPVPIPNTAVKPRAANGSWTLGPARVGCRQVFGPDVAKAASGPLFLPESLPRFRVSDVYQSTEAFSRLSEIRRISMLARILHKIGIA